MDVLTKWEEFWLLRRRMANLCDAFLVSFFTIAIDLDYLGAGLNVANSNPTVCINDMLPADFERQLTTEQTLAEILNKFEGSSSFWKNNLTIIIF
jgi:hypothetical protein